MKQIINKIKFSKLLILFFLIISCSDNIKDNPKLIQGYWVGKSVGIEIELMFEKNNECEIDFPLQGKHISTKYHIINDTILTFEYSEVKNLIKILNDKELKLNPVDGKTTPQSPLHLFSFKKI